MEALDGAMPRGYLFTITINNNLATFNAIFSQTVVAEN